MVHLAPGPKIKHGTLEEIEKTISEAQIKYNEAQAVRDEWQERYRRREGHFAEGVPDTVAQRCKELGKEVDKFMIHKLKEFIEKFEK